MVKKAKKPKKQWVYSPRSAPKPKVPEKTKIEVTEKADLLVEEFFKPQYIQPPPENDFSYETIKEKGQVYIQKLKKTHIPQDLYADLEVHRYDYMWEEVLHVLQTNKEYVHFKFYHFTSS